MNDHAATRSLHGTVLLTDYAWPDLEIEREVLGAAGLELVAGPATATTAEAIEALVRQHQPVGVLSNWAPLRAAAIAASAELRIVARLGVGLDNIAVDEATRRGVWVSNVPDFCVEEVSDHALALLLAWSRGIVKFNAETHAQQWRPATARLQRLADLTCGLIGYGRIVRCIAQQLVPFGATLLAAVAPPRRAPGLVCTISSQALPRRPPGWLVTPPRCWPPSRGPAAAMAWSTSCRSRNCCAARRW